MRVRLPIALLLSSLIVGQSSLRAQSPAPSEKRISYCKVREIIIPFQADTSRSIKEVRLYAQRNGGEWEYLTTAEPTQKGFKFITKQDGFYGLTVQTVFKDGSSEPSRDQLRSELKLVIDTVPPKITLRPFSTTDGLAGVEWEASDDNLDPGSIKLECRRPGMVDWAPINKEDRFKVRDQRTWVLKPDQHIEIRVRASDLAKNETISEGVIVSSTVGDNRQFAGSAKDDFSSASSDQTNVRIDYAALRRTLEKAHTQINDVEQKVEKLEYAALQRELEEAKKQLSDLRQRLDNLQKSRQD